MFKIGDQTIDRSQMPSFQMSQMDPTFIEEAFQDVINRNLAPIYQTNMQSSIGEQPQ